VNWRVQEEVVKYDNWIEKLYYKEFLVNPTKKWENNDGHVQTKRKASETKERNKQDAIRMQPRKKTNKDG